MKLHRIFAPSLLPALSTAVLLLACSASVASAAPPAPAGGLRLAAGALFGYQGGAGAQLNVTASRFATGFPLHLRFGTGYTSVEPGRAADARRIFINNATNGVPEKSGRRWDFRMDFLYPMRLPQIGEAYLTAGPRYSRFVGNFKYVGGNEDFDVKSNQWGVGAGLEGHFPIRSGLDLVLGGGYDYYGNDRLVGHDTIYSPDGDHVNEREDYTYADADAAVDQPKHELRMMLGLNFAFWSLVSTP